LNGRPGPNLEKNSEESIIITATVQPVGKEIKLQFVNSFIYNSDIKNNNYVGGIFNNNTLYGSVCVGNLKFEMPENLDNFDRTKVNERVYSVKIYSDSEDYQIVAAFVKSKKTGIEYRLVTPDIVYLPVNNDPENYLKNSCNILSIIAKSNNSDLDAIDEVIPEFANWRLYLVNNIIK
jgi:hypothetical protein